MRLDLRAVAVACTLLASACAEGAQLPSSSEATPSLAVEGSAAGSYIVVFRPGTRGVEDLTTQLARGGTVSYRYTVALQGFAATLPEASLEGIRRNPNVDYVVADGEVTATAETQLSATWGIDRIDQTSLPLSGTYSYTSTGADVRAYILDTGILGTHTEFTGRVLPGFSAVKDRRGTTDCNGHGTHVAGTVGGITYGVAKGVSLVPVRVLDCRGSGSWSGVIAGIDWVAANAVKPAVANMSLGGGVNQALNQAVTNAVNSGVVFVVAGSNENTDACTRSPASTPAAITVGATTITDARASYSNYGTCLDLFAPGSNITSAWYRSTTSTNTISGTSMASPHVAGAAARFLESSRNATPADVATALLANATKSVVTSAGTDSPNLLLFASSLK